MHPRRRERFVIGRAAGALYAIGHTARWGNVVVTEGLLCPSASVTLSPTPEKPRISLAPGYDPDFGIRLRANETDPGCKTRRYEDGIGCHFKSLGEKMKKLIGVAVLV